jgi:hypothetical protein
VHIRHPDDCDRCTLARHEQIEEVAQPPSAPSLDQVVSSVLTRMVPSIAGLPQGDELHELVEERSIEVYVAGLTDPDLLGLDPDAWRTVVATRVGLALAFPLGWMP